MNGPTKNQPATDQSTKDQLTKDQLTKDQRMTDQPTAHRPTAHHLAANQASPAQAVSAVAQPVTAQSMPAQPVNEQPTADRLTMPQPTAPQPAITQSKLAEAARNNSAAASCPDSAADFALRAATSTTASAATSTVVTTPQLIRWLTAITRPVHKPLFFSAFMRIVNLSLEISLFAVMGAGVVALFYGAASPIIFLGLVLIALAKAVAYYLEQFSGHYVAFKALELLRTHVFATLWPKAPAIVYRSRSGDILASLTRDVDRIEVFYAHTFAPLVAAYVVPPLALLVTGLWIGWDIVIIPALCVMLSLSLVPYVGTRRALAATADTIRTRRVLSHHVSDSIFGKEEVVGYGRADDRAAEMAKIDDEVARTAAISRRILASRRAVNIMLMLFAAISIPAVGHYSPIVTAGMVAGALRLFEGPRGVEDAVGYLDHSFAAARRLWDISHAPIRVGDGSQELVQNSAPTVAWNNVSYQYETASGQPGFELREVSIVAPAGKHTVFLGASGSGKSTCVQLLARYDDPDTGNITVDGIPITEYTLDSLRTGVVIVSQYNELLNCSIRENLLLAVPQATEEQMWQALSIAALDTDIRDMPQGLDTPVGNNGAALSGGQAQRLCLARALLMKPRVLVLDEFTAHVNVELERDIRRALAQAEVEMTLIEITHRRDSIADCDHVVLFDAGSVRAQGSAQQIRAMFS
ncbi:ATP-binding cassette domain-containing protein [Trueperella sp. LYQ143]|uniref:ATP-binding cassette domain-containing protein n=1 Tax=Trueperella sp. LYQ143 TaxID=3391059 RepID=UPI0039834CC2